MNESRLTQLYTKGEPMCPGCGRPVNECAAEDVDESFPQATESESGAIPWNEKTAPDRARPRECVRAARDALNRAYAIKERAAVPLLIEALDWLRRGLEQMVPDEQ